MEYARKQTSPRQRRIPRDGHAHDQKKADSENRKSEAESESSAIKLDLDINDEREYIHLPDSIVEPPINISPASKANNLENTTVSPSLKPLKYKNSLRGSQQNQEDYCWNHRWKIAPARRMAIFQDVVTMSFGWLMVVSTLLANYCEEFKIFSLTCNETTDFVPLESHIPTCGFSATENNEENLISMVMTHDYDLNYQGAFGPPGQLYKGKVHRPKSISSTPTILFLRNVLSGVWWYRTGTVHFEWYSSLIEIWRNSYCGFVLPTIATIAFQIVTKRGVLVVRKIFSSVFLETRMILHVKIVGSSVWVFGIPIIITKIGYNIPLEAPFFRNSNSVQMPNRGEITLWWDKRKERGSTFGRVGGRWWCMVMPAAAHTMGNVDDRARIAGKGKEPLSSFPAKQMIRLLLLNNFYPVISYRRVQKKKKATNYCIRFGHSLWSANRLPAQRVNGLLGFLQGWKILRNVRILELLEIEIVELKDLDNLSDCNGDIRTVADSDDSSESTKLQMISNHLGSSTLSRSLNSSRLYTQYKYNINTVPIKKIRITLETTRTPRERKVGIVPNPRIVLGMEAQPGKSADAQVGAAAPPTSRQRSGLQLERSSLPRIRNVRITLETIETVKLEERWFPVFHRTFIRERDEIFTPELIDAEMLQ
ncbi:hypothetical protein WN51_09373 [Melipona quadrifasciata]|uniref:Uncharacterized protein n=1 Tax=Melipona quadrifasciata TaxID=166423 RepID=A0A0N0U6F0_9HYME|nr:hypothetical protein WN51_09373 [Melipona quadrifasciata]